MSGRVVIMVLLTKHKTNLPQSISKSKLSQYLHTVVGLCSVTISTVNGTRAASLNTLCELYIKSGCRCIGVHYLPMPAEDTQMFYYMSRTYSVHLTAGGVIL